MKRRNFLKAGAAGAAGLFGSAGGLFVWVPRAGASTVSLLYYVTEGTIAQPDGEDVFFRGFSSSESTLDVPGESFVVQEGDTVQVTIVNTLNTPHSFVIDGLIDSGPIGGGQTSTVSFTVDQPGSYLYYDKLNAPYNRLVGLHGAMAVMPASSGAELYPGSPTFVQQRFWVFHDIDPLWHQTIRVGQTPSSPYVPRYFTLNGLSGRPPGAPGSGDPDVDNMHDPRSTLHGHVGDRTLVRILNAGMCSHSVHTHGNHMEWLTQNGVIRADVWKKDCLYLDNDMGRLDVIYPFEAPPDAYPPVSESVYPMHLHDEMSQTAAGGLYMFGAMTDIYFE